MIKNIIFDLGGVIITISHQEALRRFQRLGLKDAERQLDPYTQNGIFGDLEEGKITAEDFRRELSRMVGRELTYGECQHAWHGYRADLPQRNLDALKKLKQQHYRLILLSNTNPFMMDWAESEEFDGKGNPIQHYFDALYMSYRVKAMKPSEQFFRHVIEQEQINPEETLFVDDGPRNVAVAESLGIHTFCPKNGEDWTDEIYDYLK
jgi:putative hydrolase of the HAD superfamily